MQVGVIIITYNLSSEIFLLQMEAIRKFCKDEFEIQIIDNSTNIEMSKDIKYHAEAMGVNYRKTWTTSMNSSDSHSFAANLSYQFYKDKYEYFFYLDHDCLPVKEFSVIEILSGGHVMAGIGQGAKKTYFWPGALMWAKNRIDESIIDFRPNLEYGLDTGGNLYQVVEKYGKENCIFFNEAYHQNEGFNSNKYNHYVTINDGMFFHCVGASNWMHTDRHEERINSLINIIKEKINNVE